LPSFALPTNSSHFPDFYQKELLPREVYQKIMSRRILKSTIIN
jgi:hypothetical protein